MKKDYGKVDKNSNTSIIIRVDEFGGKPGVTIREFVNGTDGGYKGFTKSGTRIPADKFLEFREIINSINLEDLKASGTAAKPAAKKEEASEIEDY